MRTYGFPRRSRVYSLATLAALAASVTWAAPAEQPATWNSKELTFTYRGHTTKYTCDGLRDKVRSLLLALGAGSVRIWPTGCLGVSGPEPLASLRIRMNILAPAAADGRDTVSAHWKTVDLLAGRDGLDVAGDCELIGQVRDQLLPQFAARNVDARATCQNKQLLIGGTRLKADVLVADARAARVSAGR